MIKTFGIDRSKVEKSKVYGRVNHGTGSPQRRG